MVTRQLRNTTTFLLFLKGSVGLVTFRLPAMLIYVALQGSPSASNYIPKGKKSSRHIKRAHCLSSKTQTNLYVEKKNKNLICHFSTLIIFLLNIRVMKSFIKLILIAVIMLPYTFECINSVYYPSLITMLVLHDFMNQGDPACSIFSGHNIFMSQSSY